MSKEGVIHFSPGRLFWTGRLWYLGLTGHREADNWYPLFLLRVRRFSIDKRTRVNRQIRISPIRLIDEDGSQLGITPLEEALRIADERGLDLVEVAPSAKPPVCRIMDYGKFKYEESKKAKKASKRQHLIQIKEIKLRPKTEEHDFQFKLRHARKFLDDRNKVKFTMIFRGRELQHKDRGKILLEKVAEEIKDIAFIEIGPKQEGRNMIMIISPKH